MQAAVGVVVKEVFHIVFAVVDDAEQLFRWQLVLSGNMFQQIVEQLVLQMIEYRHFHQHHHGCDQLFFARIVIAQADAEPLVLLFGHDIVLIGRADHLLDIVAVTNHGKEGDFFGFAEPGQLLAAGF